MAANWSLAPSGDFLTPYREGLQFGLQQADRAAQRNALAQVAGGNPGGVNQLLAVNPALAMQIQQQQQAQGDRSARIRAGQAYGRGNTQEAVSALGEVGDLGGISALQDQDRQVKENQINVVSTFANRVRPLLRSGGPQAAMQALQAYLPQLRAAQLDEDDIQALAQGLETNAEATLAALADPAKLQGVALGNGGYATFDQTSGEFDVLREPDARPLVVGNGGVIYDPDTGAVVARNPKTFAPKAGAGGSSATLDAIAAELARRGRQVR